MATSSFDTTFRINPDWGVKNLKKGLDEYERNGPKYPSPSTARVLKPSDEVMEKIGKLKNHRNQHQRLSHSCRMQ